MKLKIGIALLIIQVISTYGTITGNSAEDNDELVSRFNAIY